MTPLEINKKIAEIKGIFQELRPNEIYINWAENIADAWDLFEELDGQIITKDRYSGAYSGGKWLCTYETLCPEEVLIHGPQGDDSAAKTFWSNPTWVISAETAPLAICLAWLKWKEGK